MVDLLGAPYPHPRHLRFSRDLIEAFRRELAGAPDPAPLLPVTRPTRKEDQA